VSAITMYEVAIRAGVSKTTVSHVLNQTRFVEAGTVKRVQEAIGELGYRPNRLARSLRRQETQTIALITPDNANVYWAEFARVVERAGFTAGYTVFLCNSEWSMEREHQYVDTLLERQIDGIILAVTHNSQSVLDKVIAARLPVVVVNVMPVEPKVSSVKVDEFLGGYLAGAHLLQLGHRRVGYLNTSKEYSVQTRVNGFLHAFTEAGLDAAALPTAEGDFSYASGEAGVYELLRQQPDLTALFAVNDNMALGAYKGLHRMKRRIPEDISVVGFDNIVYATALSPELTTVAQPIQQLGETACRLLLNKIEVPDSPPESVVLEPILIERESCRKPIN